MEKLALFFQKHRGSRIVCITGAGCSTDSGIPDYRSPNGQYRIPGFQPLTWSRFSSSEQERKRYWARSLFGHSKVAQSTCNPCHTALEKLHQQGLISNIVTQNVDGLHHLASNNLRNSTESELLSLLCRNIDAGSTESVMDVLHRIVSPSQITELHGNINLVQCCGCGIIFSRVSFQRSLSEINQEVLQEAVQHQHRFDRSLTRPDGDFEFPDDFLRIIRLAQCPHCQSSFVKPHVVLFGENVPSSIVTRTYAAVERAQALVCLGTSLQVYSAYRFVRFASEQNKPIIIVNRGQTRGDNLATLCVDAGVSEAMEFVWRSMNNTRSEQ